MSYIMIAISSGSIRVDIGGQSKLIKDSARTRREKMVDAAVRLLQRRADSSSKHVPPVVLFT